MIVLGIDPGTVAAGYGAVESVNGRMRLVKCGAVRARRAVELMQELDDLDDVNNVYTNFEMTAELAAEMDKG